MTHHPAPHSPAAFHGAARGRHSVSAHQPKAHGTLSRIHETKERASSLTGYCRPGLPLTAGLAFVDFPMRRNPDLRNRRDGQPLPAGAPNSGGRVISSPPARRYLHCHLRSDEAQGFPTDRFVSRTHLHVPLSFPIVSFANERSDEALTGDGNLTARAGKFAAQEGKYAR